MIRRATLNDVAREAGVSIKTASRVLSGVETVNQTLRDKVQRAAAGLDYRPNRAAAMMRSGRSDMVGMIIRDLSNPFYSTLAAGVGDIAERHGRLLITCSSEGTPHRQSSLIEAVMSQRPVGLIITPTTGTDRQLISEADRRTPIVAVDELPTGIDIDTVTFDNSRGSRSGVATAVKLGRRNFVTISAGPQLTTMGPRVAGAAEALSAAGLPVRPTVDVIGPNTTDTARTAAYSVLDGPERPDAIFCTNNVVALGVAEAIVERQADVAIVSFDDFSLSSTMPVPVIVIDHDTRQMGRAAATLLFARLDDPQLAPQHLRIATSIRLTGGLQR